MHQNIDNKYASIGNEYVTNSFGLETNTKLEDSQYIFGELLVRSTWFGNCPLIAIANQILFYVAAHY